MNKEVIIIGAGTYGSYLANCISEKNPDIQIKLFEVGNKKIQSESQIGFFSEVKGSLYKAASDGRFFGFGGTSAKWGGQLLFFSDKDFSNKEEMKEIVDCNISYKNKVLSRFFNKAPVLDENEFNTDLFVKKGIWLKFAKRNLFKNFQISKRKNIKIFENARVVRLNLNKNKIVSVVVQFGNKSRPVEFKADIFYLTGGAFETLRLLHVSDILNMEENSFGFSDHVSLRCFEIYNKSAQINSQDFQFSFVNGSMVTSRLIGEIDGVSFYIHPIFNENFKFFQGLKKMIFKGIFSTKDFLLSVGQFFLLFPFLYHYFIKKRLFLYGSWFLNIDIELPQNRNFVSLSPEVDIYRQKGIEIKYEIPEETLDKLLQIKQKVRQILIESNINFKEFESSQILYSKLEDVYHPYGLFSYSGNKTIFDVYNPVSNLYLFNTGLLRRSGGINPTASIFCLIEHHLEQEII